MFWCDKEFKGYYFISNHFARVHDGKRCVCKCGYDLISDVCIQNGCSKSMGKIEIGDEIRDEINDLVKDIVEYKTHKLDEEEDKVNDEDEKYNFSNGKGLRREPGRACNNCKVSKHITGFDLKKYIWKDCNASKVKFEHCSSILSFSGLWGHIKST